MTDPKDSEEVQKDNNNDSDNIPNDTDHIDIDSQKSPFNADPQTQKDFDSFSDENLNKPFFSGPLGGSPFSFGTSLFGSNSRRGFERVHRKFPTEPVMHNLGHNLKNDTSIPGPPIQSLHRQDPIKFDTSVNSGTQQHSQSNDKGLGDSQLDTPELLRKLFTQIQIGDLTVEQLNNAINKNFPKQAEPSVRPKFYSFNQSNNEPSYAHSYTDAQRDPNCFSVRQGPYKNYSQPDPQNFRDQYSPYRSQSTGSPSVQVINQHTLPVPDLSPFRSSDINMFDQYLIYFEEHCELYYPNRQNSWVQLLLKQVNKEIVNVMPPEAHFAWGYSLVVEYLRDYYSSTGSREETNPEMIFMRSSRRPNEALHLFSIRLIHLFKKAHPGQYHSYANSVVLIDKFVQGLDEDTKSFVIQNTIVQKTLDRPPPFRAYVELAERYEKEIRPKMHNSHNLSYPSAQKPYTPQYPYKQTQHTKAVQFGEPLTDTPYYDNNNYYQPTFDGANTQTFAGENSVSQVSHLSLQNDHGYIDNRLDNHNEPPQYHPQAQIHVEQNAEGQQRQNIPGVCNYCLRPGHYRKTCKLLEAKRQDPTSVWCSNCLMKNHRDIHCTAKVNNFVEPIKQISENPSHYPSSSFMNHSHTNHVETKYYHASRRSQLGNNAQS
ncbi:unnamed protein product, partial [Rotaria magnacalcarata]